jgi:hypothetical protein
MIAFTGSTATPQAKAGINRRLEPVDYPHQLFPHPWGVIYKELIVDEGKEPQWRTLARKLQATDLDAIFALEHTSIGVRFGKLTKYLMIDIDIRSLCHPEVNQREWDRLMKALEDVGLTDRIIVRSSHSGGLHVYFWFGEELETYKVAQLLWSVCRAGCFELRGGNIETFPNAKKYTLFPSMYNGHRLPLQPESGGLLLDEYFEEIETLDPWGEFCYRVHTSEQDMEELKRKLAWGARYHKKYARYLGCDALCNSAADWKQSLIDRLKLGWTCQGQTNELVRVACVMAWVFGDGTRNDAEVVEKLGNLSGYKEFCRHQHEMDDRVEDWMDCITKQYWPYCRPDMRPFAAMRYEQPPEAKPKSTKLHDDVMDRLRQVVAAVVDRPLPEKVGEIVKMIQEKAKEMFGKGFGINTLYRPQYASEWRILVEKVQTQMERAFSQSSGEPEETKKSPSNPVAESVFSDFSSMKVCFQVKILALDFLLLVDRGLHSATSLLTDRSIRPENLVSDKGCLIETDEFISFTNGYMTPGAAPEAISRPNQSSSTLDSSASPPATLEVGDGSENGKCSTLRIQMNQPRLLGVNDQVEFEQFGEVLDSGSESVQSNLREIMENANSPPSESLFFSAWVRTFAASKKVVDRMSAEAREPLNPTLYHQAMLAERVRLFWAGVPPSWAKFARDRFARMKIDPGWPPGYCE